MFWKSSPIPHLELHARCLVTVSRHYRTSAHHVEVGHRVCCPTSVIGLFMVLVGLPLVVACARAVEVSSDVAIALAQNIEIGSCSLRPRILVWWLIDSMCDLTVFTPIQVIFIVS